VTVRYSGPRCPKFADPCAKRCRVIVGIQMVPDLCGVMISIDCMRSEQSRLEPHTMFYIPHSCLFVFIDGRREVTINLNNLRDRHVPNKRKLITGSHHLNDACSKMKLTVLSFIMLNEEPATNVRIFRRHSVTGYKYECC